VTEDSKPVGSGRSTVEFIIVVNSTIITNASSENLFRKTPEWIKEDPFSFLTLLHASRRAQKVL